MSATSDLSAAEGLIAWHQTSYAAHGFGAWAVLLKDGSEFVGQAGLIRHEHAVELFFSFLPQFWGRGLATEVARACRDYAFTHLDLDRLIGIIHPENRPAIAVATKVGMSYVGPFRLWERDNALYEIHRAGYPGNQE